MKRGSTGRFVVVSSVGEKCRAFIPDTLPPAPPLNIDSEIQEFLTRAMLALGRLDGLSRVLPDPSLFLYMYVRKEALLSSQIEGTQSSLSELLLFELESISGKLIDDVREVSNYIAAMNLGIDKIRQGFPISSRLLRDIHSVLLAKGRGSKSDPGEFRRSQNWIGGTRPGTAVFVPPPPQDISTLMGDLERFIHNPSIKIPGLIKAALVHAQFETIHPFLDGNGRLGRLLITLLLCSENILKEPMLYLSLYLKTHRQKYYDILQTIRLHGDWEGWIRFFLIGVSDISEQAVGTATRLLELFERDRQKIEEIGTGRGSYLRVYMFFQHRPVSSISRIAHELSLSIPTVTSALKRLTELEIMTEITGKKRNRLFAYREYLGILNEGTEPIGNKRLPESDQ